MPELEPIPIKMDKKVFRNHFRNVRDNLFRSLNTDEMELSNEDAEAIKALSVTEIEQMQWDKDPVMNKRIAQYHERTVKQMQAILDAKAIYDTSYESARKAIELAKARYIIEVKKVTKGLV